MKKIEEYAGSWNLGQDENCCWIITSGVPGLCEAPENLGPYAIPATENGAPNEWIRALRDGRARP